MVGVGEIAAVEDFIKSLLHLKEERLFVCDNGDNDLKQDG